MGASEKAVAAVMETLGCKERVVHDLRWCMTHDVIGALWTHRGCALAVAAADAAVDTDRPSIQAQALRDYANDLAAYDYGNDMLLAAANIVGDLRARADIASIYVTRSDK